MPRRTPRLLAAALLLALPAAVPAQTSFQRPTLRRPALPSRAQPVRPASPAASHAAPDPAPAAPPAPAPTLTTNAFGDVLTNRPYGEYRFPYGTTPEQRALIESPRFDLLPRKPLVLKKSEDWKKILDLQMQTGACILLRFEQTSQSKDPSGNYSNSEKGRASWFAKRTAVQRDWQKAAALFLQVDVVLPGNRDIQEFAAKMRQGYNGLYYVLRPGESRTAYLKVFDYDPRTKELELLPLEDCLANLRAASTPAYKSLIP